MIMRDSRCEGVMLLCGFGVMVLSCVREVGVVMMNRDV